MININKVASNPFLFFFLLLMFVFALHYFTSNGNLSYTRSVQLVMSLPSLVVLRCPTICLTLSSSDGFLYAKRF